MSEPRDIDRLVGSRYEVAAPSDALRHRVATAVAQAAAAEGERRACRRRGRRLALAVAACLCLVLIPALLSRSELVLLPSLQLVAAANAAERAPAVHRITWRILPDGRQVPEVEAWIQAPLYKEIRVAEGRQLARGFDGQADWEYDPLQRRVTTRPALDPELPVELIVGHALERAIHDGDGRLVIEDAVEDGEPVRRITGGRPGLGERFVVYVDARSDRPRRMDVYQRPYLEGAGERGPERLAERTEFDYPEVKPASFFMPAPPEGTSVVAKAGADQPSAEEVKQTLTGAPAAVLQAPDGPQVRVLDIAQNEQGLVFVACAPPSAEVQYRSLQVHAAGGSGYLLLRQFHPQEASRYTGIVPGAAPALVGGAIFCAADPSAEQSRPTRLTAVLNEGRRLYQTSLAVSPDTVRAIRGAPAWWAALAPTPDVASLEADARIAQATFWLPRDATVAERLAMELVLAGESGSTPAAKLDHWFLLGDARAALGKIDDARFAYESALALLPTLKPREREVWRHKLNGALERLPAQGAD